MRTLPDHHGRVQIAVSPDGRLAATGDGDGALRIWEVASARLLAVLGPRSGEVVMVAFAPGGGLVAGSSNGAIRRWDLSSGTLSGEMDWPGEHAPGSAALSPDGRLVAAIQKDHSITVRAASTFAEVARIPGEGSESAVSFGHNSATLDVVGENLSVRRWRLDGPAPSQIQGPDIQGWTLAVSPDGTLGAAVEPSAGVRIWDMVAGRPKALLQGVAGPTMAAAFVPGSPLLVASASADGSVRLWDPAGGQPLITLDGLKVWGARAFSVSADGRVLGVAGSEGSAALWDLRYFDRHIAGNLDYQAGRLRLPDGNATAEDLSARITATLLGPGTGGPGAGLDPDAVGAWGLATLSPPAKASKSAPNP